MINPSLRRHTRCALIRLALVGMGLASAACDGITNGVAFATTPSPVPVVPRFQSVLTFSPELGNQTVINATDCSGVVFATPFDLVVHADIRTLTMSVVRLRPLDGPTPIGQVVTISTPQLNAQFGTTVIAAGTSRAFELLPVFTCVVRRPSSVNATAVLVDQRGVESTLTVTTGVR